MQPRLTTPRQTKDKLNESLLFKERINYPAFKDANGDSWTVYVQRENPEVVEDSKDHKDQNLPKSFVFNVYACCEFSLDNIFMNNPDLKSRIFEILQTSQFRFLVHRATISEIFNDRFHEKIITHYESFKAYVKQNTFLQKKEKMVRDRFESQFNFGGFL